MVGDYLHTEEIRAFLAAVRERDDLRALHAEGARGRERLRETLSSTQEAFMEDLRALLRVLGLFDGARPQSPHEVMVMATGEVAKLRAQIETVRALHRPEERWATSNSDERGLECRHCSGKRQTLWPCETIQALDGGDQ